MDQPEGRWPQPEQAVSLRIDQDILRLVPQWWPALSDPHQRRAACIRGDPTGQALTGNSGRAQELPVSRAQRPVFRLQRNPRARRECVVVGLV